MKDSYTTNSRYLTDIFSLWKVGRMYFLSSGVKWLISECCTPAAALPQFPLFLAHWCDLFSSVDWGLALVNAGRFGLVLDWALLLQEERVTHWRTIIWGPSAPKTETTTKMRQEAVPWRTKAVGGTTLATPPIWTACTTTVTTRLTLTAWTGRPGKATTTPSNAPRWRSGLATSKQVYTGSADWVIYLWCLNSSQLLLVFWYGTVFFCSFASLRWAQLKHTFKGRALLEGG